MSVRSRSRRRANHAPASGALQCALTAVHADEGAEIDRGDLRADIGAGYPGKPLRVSFTVLNEVTRRPVPNALLDVRLANDPAHGIVITDKEGVAHVQTIRPARSTGAPDAPDDDLALDLRVFAGGTVAHTGRLRLPAGAGGAVDAVLRIAR